MSENQPIQNDLEKKVIELEKKLNELIINKGMRENVVLAPNEEEKPKRKNKTPQYIIDANKRYYQKKKNNLDFRLKIRERNKKARELKTNKTVTSNKEPIIKMLNKPITLSFYDDNDDIGF